MSLFRRWLFVLGGCLLPWLASAEPQMQGAAAAEILSVGVVPQHSASRLARLWVPLLRELGQQSGLELRFRTAPDIPTFERRLADGVYDIAYMNPYHYTVFSQTPGYRGFAHEAGKQLAGILVVRRDSPLQRLEDLQGSQVAFPAPAAFAASVLTRAELARRNIDITPAFVSSHDSVYYAVAKGLYPAGGGVVGTLEGIDPKVGKELRILWQSPGYTPHAFAAHPRVPADKVARLLAAMQQLDRSARGRALLEAVNLHGVAAADDRAWDDVRGLGLERLDPVVRP